MTEYWNDYPECLSIIHRRLFDEDIDYKQFLINKEYNFGRALILNCGNGWVERELYDYGIIKSAIGIEYNEVLIKECESKKEGRNLHYVCHDLNTVMFEDNSFDVVINYSTGHRIRYIESVWLNIQKWLKPGGYFIQHDYIGPPRNQYTRTQWAAMNELNNTLDPSVKKHLVYPSLETDTIHSDKMIPLTYDIFTVLYHKKSGGVLAYELLTHNDNLFHSELEERKNIVSILMNKDEKYTKDTGESFFHFIIAKNTKKDVNVNKYITRMKERERLADYTHGHYSYNKCAAGDIILFNDANSIDNSLFVHGFSYAESSGRWSIDDSSIIRFKIDTPRPTEIYLVVQSLPDYAQEVLIEINGFISTTVVKNNRLLKIPILNCPNEVILILRYANVKTPKELNINEDERKLALFFRTMYLL